MEIKQIKAHKEENLRKKKKKNFLYFSIYLFIYRNQLSPDIFCFIIFILE
jgi:hypothetical protein